MSRPHRTQRAAARPDAAGSDPSVDSAAEVDERLPDLDEQSAALSADLVRVYLNEIGKVALLNAEQEVELSKRIEAGLYADHLLADPNTKLTPAKRRDLQALADRRPRGPRSTCCRPTCGWSSRWPSATPATVCLSWT